MKQKKEEGIILSFYTTPEFRAELKRAAEEEDRTVSRLINRALRQYLERRKK